MTSRRGDPEHDDAWRGDVAAYALGALDGAELDLLQDHLAGCPSCRDELAALQAVVDTLAISPPPADPSPALKSRIMATVNAEAELLAAAGARADVPAGSRAGSPTGPAGRAGGVLARWRDRLTGRRLVFVPVGATLAGAVAAVALVAATLTGSGSPTTYVTTARVTAAAGLGATARVQRTGSHLRLVVAHLAPPRAGHTYEAWTLRPGGAPAPAGTFTTGSGTVAISGDARRVGEVLVTEEPAGGSSVPTSAPLITGAVT